MADPPFKIGDIVRLKSGGPKMTVDSNFGHDVYAAWFGGTKHERARFHVDSIELGKDGPKNGPLKTTKK